jgi:hypothetical protein
LDFRLFQLGYRLKEIFEHLYAVPLLNLILVRCREAVLRKRFCLIEQGFFDNTIFIFGDECLAPLNVSGTATPDWCST